MAFSTVFRHWSRVLDATLLRRITSPTGWFDAIPALVMGSDFEVQRNFAGDVSCPHPVNALATVAKPSVSSKHSGIRRRVSIDRLWSQPDGWNGEERAAIG